MTNPPPVAPVVTDEMVAVAIGAYDHECEHFDTETQDALDMHTSAMRAAITAALEATGELERLRAENKKLRMDRGFAIGWITALANNPYKPMTWMQTREAAADCLAALQGDAP